MISKFVRRFSTQAAQGTKFQAPLINTQEFHNKTSKFKEECEKTANAFREYGCIIIKDPRVNEQHNAEFIDLMERYFEKRSKAFYAKQPVPDVFPDLGYQTGATPEYIEKARAHQDIMKSYTQENKALSPDTPIFDAKWRFFHRIGEKPDDKAFVDPPKTIPKDFPEWERTMDKWGNLMLDCCLTVAEMMAIGLGIERRAFVDRMKGGAHLLAPTGSDLSKYKKGTVFAGFHYDLNFLTIHGKSRFPGLFCWNNKKQKFPVSVPEGHLLLQSGIQVELLTGGHIQAGFHEVIYTDKTEEAFNKAKKEGKSTWRVSSTLFSHIRHDVNMQPIDKFATKENLAKYKKQTAGEQVLEELKAISLVNH